MSDIQSWEFDETQVEEFSGFELIPEGEHRIRVKDIVPEVSKKGDDMLKITFDVSNYSSKLFHYLVFFKDAEKRKYTHTNLSYIFKSFDGINKDNFKDLSVWLGKVGACLVKHEEYNGKDSAKVSYFISKEDAKNLPEWVEKGKSKTVKDYVNDIKNNNEDVPF